MSPRRGCLALLLTTGLFGTLAPVAAAHQSLGRQLIQPSSQSVAPPTFKLSANQVKAITGRLPLVESLLAKQAGVALVLLLCGLVHAVRPHRGLRPISHRPAWPRAAGDRDRRGARSGRANLDGLTRCGGR